MKPCRILVALFLAACCASAQSERLLERADITFLGSFRADGTGPGDLRLAYGGDGLAHSGDSLYLACHKQSDTVAEISIPGTGTGDYADLPLATTIQQCADPFDGRIAEIVAGQEEVSGLFVYDGRLIANAQGSYDGGCVQPVSHGAGSLDLSIPDDFTGFFRIDGSAVPRAMAGYMAIVPPAWQPLLGAPVLTGNSGGNIVSCYSAGPGATLFDPNDIGALDPVPGQTLLNYPDNTDPLARQYFSWRARTTVDGAAFPAGTRTVLFIGSNGEQGCYGWRTQDPDKSGLVAPELPNKEYCYSTCSPAWGGQGTGGHNLQPVVWAYDALDLLAVKQGTMLPSEVAPYASWTLPEIRSGNCSTIRGAAFDPATNRLYISASYTESPLFHVYEINTGDPLVPDTTPPAAPVVVVTPSSRSHRLDWAPNTESDLAGYHVYTADSQSGPYSRVTRFPGAPAEWVFVACQSYYAHPGCLPADAAGALLPIQLWARVASVDIHGNESLSDPVLVMGEAPPVCVEGDPCWCEPGGPGYPCSSCVPSDVALLINGVIVYETLVGCDDV